MKLVVQRVRRASVVVHGERVAEIERGAAVLVGVGRDDDRADAEFLARKTSGLRLFDDEQGKMNLDMAAVNGAFLVVSQFTLYGDCSRGRRPSYIQAAPPEQAEELYEYYAECLRRLGHEVQTGRFRAHMALALENDGPVTLLLESRVR